MRKEIRDQLKKVVFSKNKITSKQNTWNKIHPKRQITKKSVDRFSKIDRPINPSKKIEKAISSDYKLSEPSPLRHQEASNQSVEYTDQIIYEPILNPFISNTEDIIGSPCFQTPVIKNSQTNNPPQPSHHERQQLGFLNHCIRAINAPATNNSIIETNSGYMDNPANSNSRSNTNNLTNDLS